MRRQKKVNDHHPLLGGRERQRIAKEEDPRRFGGAKKALMERLSRPSCLKPFQRGEAQAATPDGPAWMNRETKKN